MGLNDDWRRRSLAAVWHPCTQMARLDAVPPLPIARGEGPWLFDTDADPAEHRDLTARHPDLVRALQSAFGGWVAYQMAYEGRS